MDDSYVLKGVPVNFEKSIKKQRLIYKMTGSVIFNYVFGYIMMLFYMAFGIIIFWFHGRYAPLWLWLVFVLYISWMIANLFLRDSLIKIDGRELSVNKQNMVLTLDEFYRNLTFQVDSENELRSVKPSYRPIWGRVITVFFDKNCIYLNISTLGKDDLPTFVHGFTNYLKARRIAKYFRANYQ